MINYTDINSECLDSTDSFSGYTADELRALKERWEQEESLLNNADVCGFNGGKIQIKEPAELRPPTGDYEKVCKEDLDNLQRSAKKYRFNQRLAQEREAEKRSRNVSTIEVYADMIKVKTSVKGTLKGGGERKECKGFSDSSRRRLIQKMAQWNLNGLYSTFLTLTYPIVYAANWQIWKRDLDVLFKRLERRYPELVGSCWRVEFQRRAAPHFHLILATNESMCTCGGARKKMRKGKVVYVHRGHCRIHKFRKEVAVMWADIVKEGYRLSGGDMEAYAPEYKKHKKAGTGVEQVQGRRQLMAYVSKYMAKIDQASAPDEWGRNWGFRNINGKLDFSPVEIIEIDYDESVQLKRLVRKWLRSRGNVRYANMLNMRVSYSILGLGADSENGRVAYRMLGAVNAGLFAPHISPRAPLDIGCSGQATFLERVQKGLYDTRLGLNDGERVTTPAGEGTISRVYHCQILNKLRCAVYLDEKQANGARLAIFDLWQVRAIGPAPADVEQASLWQL